LSSRFQGEIALASEEGETHRLIDFVGEIRTGRRTTVSNVRDNVNIKLSDASGDGTGQAPIEYDTALRCCRANT